MASSADGYCGIFCGACSVSRHGETGRGDAFTSCLRGVPARELACQGCKSDVRYVGCRVCTIRECAVARGVPHCADCPEYPCRTYRGWQSVGKLLPHVREAGASGAAIRSGGADAWLSAQVKRWSCPQCGERFSWYAARCSGCGRGLRAEAYALSGVRRIVAGWLLRAAYRRARRAAPQG